MLENMTQRERTLAILLACLVPLALSFTAIYWFIQTYGANTLQIIELSAQVSDEQTKTLQARKAAKRLDFYQYSSLPQDLTKSSAEYQLWLLELAGRHGLKDYKVRSQVGQVLKFKNKEIGDCQTLRFEADCGLENVTAFLYELYSLKTLHRVKSIRLAPKMAVVNGKKVRTGEMALNLDIELAVLKGGNEKFNFESAKLELPRKLEDYQQSIVNRNIFGPPNNTPIVAVRPSSSYTSNSEFKISLRGEDADKDDALSFSMLNSEIEGAKLEPRAGTREAFLVIPPTKAGTYGFKVGIKDSGFPAKESYAEFKLVVADPPNKKPSVLAKLENPYPPDRSIEIGLEGTDGNEQDVLQFAIVEGVEGAEIVKESETDRNPILRLPGMDVGKYPFRISVRDGKESESDKLVERDFEVEVVRQFSHLNETRITSIMRDKSGKWSVNVRVRTAGQRYKLFEGDSFEVERQTWKVEKIEAQQVVFLVGNQRMTLDPGMPFSTPKRVESFSTAEEQAPSKDDAS
jgi:hypothetical protein